MVVIVGLLCCLVSVMNVSLVGIVMCLMIVSVCVCVLVSVVELCVSVNLIFDLMRLSIDCFWLILVIFIGCVLVFVKCCDSSWWCVDVGGV